MANTPLSKPLRPTEPPSRHSIGASTAARLRPNANPPHRPHQPTPTRAKLEHAATAPATPLNTMRSGTSSNAAVHACQHCHLMDTRFYCDSCLATRIEAHRTEMRRLSIARDKAKASINPLLFDRFGSNSPSAIPTSVPPPMPIPTIDETELPDPFDTRAADASSVEASHGRLLLHSLIQLRGKRAAMLSRVQSVHQCISESQHVHLEGEQVLKEKRAQIALRKQSLAKAWSGLEGSSASASSSTVAQRSRPSAKSHWVARPAAEHKDGPPTQTDVYTHYERQQQSDHLGSISASATASTDHHDHQLGALITRARHHLTALRSEADTVSAELAATRATLARQAFKLFSVASSSSSSSPSEAPPLAKSRSGLYGASQLDHRANLRGSNRHVISASRPPSRSQAAPSAIPLSSSNNWWSITSLPLPLPSEVRRYPRETVNGAFTYAVSLLRLVAGYLGVALPFSIEQHKGRLAIRPDPLWDGGGGSSAKTLHLSSSAYTHLTASNSAVTASRQSKLNNLAESTYGLGASTLSTIESYIHLPAGTNLPWGLSSTAAQSSPSGPGPGPDSEDKGANAERSGRRPEPDARTNSSKSKADQAAKSFVSALVMLSYDVAYLASTQGIQLDLVAAAANPLDLLSRALQQNAKLGRLAHANHIQASSIQGLSLPSLDYEQLAQILEPNDAAADSYKRGTSKLTAKPDSADNKRATSRQNTSRPNSKQPVAEILEQSYIDAGAAAASVLNIKDSSTMARKTSSWQRTPDPSVLRKTGRAPNVTASQQAVSSLQKQRIGADKHLATASAPAAPAAAAPPPSSLDFLRQRGLNATKAKASASDTNALTSTTTLTASAAKVGPGAVIFNGVEVGVGNIGGSHDPTRALDKKARKQSADEGWNLI